MIREHQARNIKLVMNKQLGKVKLVLLYNVTIMGSSSLTGDIRIH
ncbi:hypothetical protein ALT1644_80128 [Alteromonas macleodii]